MPNVESFETQPLSRSRLLSRDTREVAIRVLCRLASKGEDKKACAPCHRDDGFDDERAAAACAGSDDEEGDDVDGCIGAPRQACCCCCWGLARNAAGSAEPVASRIIDAIFCKLR